MQEAAPFLARFPGVGAEGEAGALEGAVVHPLGDVAQDPRSPPPRALASGRRPRPGRQVAWGVFRFIVGKARLAEPGNRAVRVPCPGLRTRGKAGVRKCVHGRASGGCVKLRMLGFVPQPNLRFTGVAEPPKPCDMSGGASPGADRENVFS